MGVLGLWQILESVGHPIKIEGLEGKRLGVDANVWLYKFIRGFREKDNVSNIDSHKLGLFNRVSKLLFYKIKPIFVFDGPAPVLKRRTLERRQNVRNKHLEKAQDMAMKLLADQLKERYPDVNIDGVKIPLPDLRSHNLVAAEKFTDEDRELFYLPPEVKELDNDDDDDFEAKDDVAEIKPRSVKSESIVYHIDSDDDIKPDLKPSIDIHSDEFANLPAEIRYEILQDIKESRRRIRRTHALPDDAGSFSNLQMERLRTRRMIQEKIEQCEKDICSAWTGECDGQTIRSFRMQSDANSTMLYVQNTASKSGELHPFKSESEQQKLPNTPQLTTTPQQTGSQKSNYLMKQSPYQQQGEPLIRLELQRRLKGNLLSQRDPPMPELRLSPEGEQSPEVRLSPERDPASTHGDSVVILSPEPQQTEQQSGGQSSPKSISSQEPLSPPKSQTELFSEVNESPPTLKDSMVTLSPEPRQLEQQSSPQPFSSPTSQAQQQLPKTRLSLKKNQSSIHEESVIILSPEPRELENQKSTNDDDSVMILSPEPRQPKQRSTIDDESVIILSPEPQQSERQSTPEPTSPPYQPQESQSELQAEKEQLSEKQNSPDLHLSKQSDGSQKQPEQSQSQPRSTQPFYIQQSTTAQASRTNKVTSKIVEEAKELLRLFGVPYIDASGEAEAQCALLEKLKLTEGTITDDSDVWLFGAQNVYRYFFSDDKYVMQYKMTDIEFHIRMTRENLVCFAMLVGSDYTDGIMNIGPVTALEVLSEFPGENMEPLEKFKNWKVIYETSRDRIPGSKKREKLLKFRLPDEFPSRAVFDGYMRPVADCSTENFTWGTPELDELREYARRNFGWDTKKIDDKLLPVMKKLSERKTQPTIDSFFFKTAANQNPELFRSKRVNQALDKIAKTTSRKAGEQVEVILTEDEDEDDDDCSVEPKIKKTTAKEKAPPKRGKGGARTKNGPAGVNRKVGDSSTSDDATRKRRKVKVK